MQLYSCKSLKDKFIYAIAFFNFMKLTRQEQLERMLSQIDPEISEAWDSFMDWMEFYHPVQLPYQSLPISRATSTSNNMPGNRIISSYSTNPK